MCENTVEHIESAFFDFTVGNIRLEANEVRALSRFVGEWRDIDAIPELFAVFW